MQFFKRNLSGKLNKSLSSIIILLAIFSVAGCYNNKEELLYPGSTIPVNCDSTPAKFGANVQPLFLSRCAIPLCHNSTASGGLIFETYSQISASRDRINVRAIIQKSMPPTGPLLPAEVNKIKCWLDEGALNN